MKAGRHARASVTACLPILATACGRISFAPVAVVESDARVTADVADIDALGVFMNVSPVAVLNTSFQEDDPSLTTDLLEIYFASDRPGSLGFKDIWVATRASPSDPFSSPQHVSELSTAERESDPKVSGDGLSIWFATGRFSGASDEIMYATRSARGQPWSAPIRLLELSTSDNEGGASVDATGLYMVFRKGQPGFADLHSGNRTSGVWASTAIPELNSTEEDTAPWLLGNAVVLYFASDRTGGAGQRDLYRAVRSTPEAPFQDLQPVLGLNSTDTETDPWVSDDERTIVFSSGGGTGMDLYEASR